MLTDLELLEVTIRQAHQWYAGGRLRPSELVDSYLRRVYSLDLDTSDGPPVNSVVRVDATVGEQAEAADTEVSRDGVSKRLHGIPVWVKDNVDVRGLPTTCGCRALDGVIADSDAAVVSKLRRAGAIIMGKVGMTELGNGTSAYSTMSGRIGNSYDPRSAPGGSSNGSAVATSMNFGVLSVGVDDCGSIVDPATRNGCVGLRPTVGLVSREGLFMFSASDTTPGPIARTVQDAALMFDAMCEVPDQVVATGLADEVSFEGLRVGVVESIGHRTFEVADRPVDKRPALTQSLEQLEAAGAVVIRDLHIDDCRMGRYSKIEYHNSMVTALRRRSAPPRTLYELNSSSDLAPHNSSKPGRFRDHLGVLSRRLPNVFRGRYKRVVHHNRGLVESLMDDRKLDCLVSLSHWLPIMLATLARTPHLTVPASILHVGQGDPHTVNKTSRPVGMSFIGRPRSDSRLLQIGAAFERLGGGRRPPDREMAGGGPVAEFDAQRFSRLKGEISRVSTEVLKMGPEGYAHPTHEEFRVLVDRIKNNELAVVQNRGGAG